MADFEEEFEEEEAGFDDEIDEDEIYKELPPWANDENLRLHQEVGEKKERLEQVNGELGESRQRFDTMKEHFKNVQTELQHTQALLEARNRELDTEKHLKVLVDKETSRLRTDLKKLAETNSSAQDQLNTIQNNAFVSSEKLEQFREQMNWNQEELLQWSLAAKQKEEDQEALEKYQRVDNTKVKQLALKQEKLAHQFHQKKIELSEEITETQSMQIELDRSAEEYRNLHLQRQQLIQQWADSNKVMEARDQAIAEAGEQVAVLKGQLNQLQEALQEQKKFLEQEEANNVKLDNVIKLKEREAATKRLELHNVKQGMNEFEDEVGAIQNELTKAVVEVGKAQKKNEQLGQEKESKEKQNASLNEELIAVEMELERSMEKAQDLTQQSHRIDEFHKKHEENLKQLTKALHKFKEDMFKQSQDLFSLRKEEASLTAEIASAQSKGHNLRQRIIELDQRSLKQQEMLYSIEFQAQQLERKVAYASGKRSVEETMALNARIADLKEKLEEQQKIHHMLSSQVKRLNDQLRAAKRVYDSAEQEIASLSGQINNTELENSTAQTELRSVKKGREELMVQQNEFGLDIKRLQQQLSHLSSLVAQLEKEEHDFKLALIQREKELEARIEVQLAEVKVVQESRALAARDAKEREAKIDKLKSKFAVVAGKMQSAEEGEDGEALQARIVIQAAQEREELKRQGDELHSKVQEATQNLLKLAKTMDYLVKRNDAMRKSYRKADESSPDVQTLTQLEQRNKVETDELFRSKNYLRELAAELDEREDVMQQVRMDTETMTARIEELRGELKEVQKAVQQQAVAKARAEDSVDALKKASSHELTAAEQFVWLQQQKQRQQAVMTFISDYLQQHPELQGAIAQVFSEHKLAFEPTRPSTSMTQHSALSVSTVISSASARRAKKVVTPKSIQLAHPTVRQNSKGKGKVMRGLSGLSATRPVAH